MINLTNFQEDCADTALQMVSVSENSIDIINKKFWCNPMNAQNTRKLQAGGMATCGIFVV